MAFRKNDLDVAAIHHHMTGATYHHFTLNQDKEAGSLPAISVRAGFASASATPA